jgi:hypothetical protein
MIDRSLQWYVMQVAGSSASASANHPSGWKLQCTYVSLLQLAVHTNDRYRSLQWRPYVTPYARHTHETATALADILLKKFSSCRYCRSLPKLSQQSAQQKFLHRRRITEALLQSIADKYFIRFKI